MVKRIGHPDPSCTPLSLCQVFVFCLLNLFVTHDMVGKNMTSEEKVDVLTLHVAQIGWKSISEHTGFSKGAIFALIEKAQLLLHSKVPPGVVVVSGCPADGTCRCSLLWVTRNLAMP